MKIKFEFNFETIKLITNNIIIWKIFSIYINYFKKKIILQYKNNLYKKLNCTRFSIFFIIKNSECK